MRHILLLLLAAGALAAADGDLERLFTRPYLWGTQPQSPEWARKRPLCVFLWNESGGRFLDLYSYDAAAKQRHRLTRLDGVSDPHNPPSDAEDVRLRGHRAPDPGLTSFSISDDGKRVAFAWKGDIYWIAADGSGTARRVTQTRAAESAPRISPDGGRIAYTRGGELFVQDLSGGPLVQLTEAAGGSAGSVEWSPNGRRLLYSLSKRGRMQILPNYSGRFVKAPEFPRTVAGDEPPHPVLYVVDAAGGKPVRLGEAYNGAWSPDGTRVLAGYGTPDQKTLRLLIYEATTGSSRRLHELRDDRWVAQTFWMWSPDGREVAFSSDKDGYIHLYRIPAGGGDPAPITSGNWELDTERFGFAPQWVAGRLFYASTEAGTNERQFYSILPDGTGKQRISRGEGVHVGRISEDGAHVAMLSADLRTPLELYVDGSRVTTSTQAGFPAWKWPETRFVEFPSRGDRATVKAKLLLPPGYDPARRDGKRWPAVFFIHGAGIASSVLKQFGSYQDQRFIYNTHLTSLGYVVMDLDYRGSSGYGRAWRTGVYLNMGGPDLEDVLGAVDYLAGLGNIDTTKLGIWGVSYGGFMTNMALFRAPGVFRAGSSWAAVNDWENYNDGYTRERLTTPAENPEAYRRSSPILYSHNLRDALLLIHGLGDSNVLAQDTIQLSEKLIQEGRPFDEILYPQENHGFVRDETWIDALRRTTALFEKHLK